MTEEIIINEKSLQAVLKRYDELEQENKELKEKNVELQITLNEFDRFNKYRSALEEIREIADIIYNTNCNYVSESKNILDKINEALK